MLEESLLDLSTETEDLHVKDLADRVRKLQKLGAVDGLTRNDHADGNDLAKHRSATSTDEQEEVEKDH